MTTLGVTVVLAREWPSLSFCRSGVDVAFMSLQAH